MKGSEYLEERPSVQGGGGNDKEGNKKGGEKVERPLTSSGKGKWEDCLLS